MACLLRRRCQNPGSAPSVEDHLDHADHGGSRRAHGRGAHPGLAGALLGGLRRHQAGPGRGPAQPARVAVPDACGPRGDRRRPRQRREGAHPGRPLRAPPAGGSCHWADQDRSHRPQHRGDPGHGHLLAGEGARPLQEHPPPGTTRHRRDRRAPNDVSRAVSSHRRHPERRRDPNRDALRRIHLHGPASRDRRPERRRDHQAGRVPAAGADRVSPAVQRRPALCGLRQAHPHRHLRHHGRGPLAGAQA